MKEIIIIDTIRNSYSAEEAAERSITVAELIEILEELDQEAKVITGHDNRYTYGSIKMSHINTEG